MVGKDEILLGLGVGPFGRSAGGPISAASDKRTRGSRGGCAIAG